MGNREGKKAALTQVFALSSNIPPKKRSHISSHQYMEMNTRNIDIKTAPGTRLREVVSHCQENIHAIHQLPVVSETIADEQRHDDGTMTLTMTMTRTMAMTMTTIMARATRRRQR